MESASHEDGTLLGFVESLMSDLWMGDTSVTTEKGDGGGTDLGRAALIEQLAVVASLTEDRESRQDRENGL